LSKFLEIINWYMFYNFFDLLHQNNKDAFSEQDSIHRKKKTLTKKRWIVWLFIC